MTLTIQQAIDTIIAAVPGAPFPETVDTVKIGDASQPTTGIVTTFLTTCEVIEKAVTLNANFIITHEPTFYNHLDDIDWLRADEVYRAKRHLIEENGLVVWRFHDYLHSIKPDITVIGMQRELGWETHARAGDDYNCCNIPVMPLRQLVDHVKTRLGIDTVRIIGDLELPCQNIALIPGFPPAQWQIGLLGRADIDVLICGEIHEWETSEYARDAHHLGLNKALIVTGHAASEEPGMKWIIPWLQERLPGTSITFVPTGKLFHYA